MSIPPCLIILFFAWIFSCVIRNPRELRELCTHFLSGLIDFLCFCYGSSNPEAMKRDFAAQKTELIRARDAAEGKYQHLLRSYRKLQAANEETTKHHDDMRDKIGDVRRELNAATDQVKRLSADPSGIKMQELHDEIASWRRENYEYEKVIWERNREIEELEEELERRCKHVEAADKRVQEAVEAEDVLRKECHELTVKNQRMQKENFEHHKKVVVFEKMLDVLHKMGEQDDRELLPAAIVYTEALRLAGVDFRDVKVDERRFELLRDYVIGGGAGVNRVLAPQQQYKGFRASPEFARMYF